MSIGITRSVVVNLNSDNELTFCPLLIISLALTGLGELLRNSQLSSSKKHAIGIKLSFSCDFIVPLIAKYTQTKPFFTCGMRIVGDTTCKFRGVGTAKGVV